MDKNKLFNDLFDQSMKMKKPKNDLNRLSEVLDNISEDLSKLEKSGSHKYVKRTGGPGNYKYWYTSPTGGLTEGKNAPIGHEHHEPEKIEVSNNHKEFEDMLNQALGIGNKPKKDSEHTKTPHERSNIIDFPKKKIVVKDKPYFNIKGWTVSRKTPNTMTHGTHGTLTKIDNKDGTLSMVHNGRIIKDQSGRKKIPKNIFNEVIKDYMNSLNKIIITKK